MDLSAWLETAKRGTERDAVLGAPLLERALAFLRPGEAARPSSPRTILRGSSGLEGAAKARRSAATVNKAWNLSAADCDQRLCTIGLKAGPETAGAVSASRSAHYFWASPLFLGFARPAAGGEWGTLWTDVKPKDALGPAGIPVSADAPLSLKRGSIASLIKGIWEHKWAAGHARGLRGNESRIAVFEEQRNFGEHGISTCDNFMEEHCGKRRDRHGWGQVVICSLRDLSQRLLERFLRDFAEFPSGNTNSENRGARAGVLKMSWGVSGVGLRASAYTLVVPFSVRTFEGEVEVRQTDVEIFGSEPPHSYVEHRSELVRRGESDLMKSATEALFPPGESKSSVHIEISMTWTITNRGRGFVFPGAPSERLEYQDEIKTTLTLKDVEVRYRGRLLAMSPVLPHTCAVLPARGAPGDSPFYNIRGGSHARTIGDARLLQWLPAPAERARAAEEASRVAKQEKAERYAGWEAASKRTKEEIEADESGRRKRKRDEIEDKLSRDLERARNLERAHKRWIGANVLQATPEGWRESRPSWTTGIRPESDEVGVETSVFQGPLRR